MSTYAMSLTLSNIRTITVMIVDIFVMWLLFYYALRIVRTNSRTIQIFKGIILVVAVDILSKFLGLKTLQFVTDMFINWGFLAIIIIFQPEIRNLLEKIGKSNVFSRITTLSGNEKERLVDQIVTAVMLLSKDQTGALISIEQSQSLDDFIATGTKLNSDVTAELLTSLFVTSTPLHDGAVIIQGDKIACASAYFPPTNMELPSRYGARHRAAIGISEITDCVTIVVSEETGSVSITEGGKIFIVNREELRNYLLRVICGEAMEVRNTGSIPARSVVIEDEEKKKSVLSKLAVRKHEAADHTSDHSNTTKIHAQADQEAKAASIKLPHKKKRPAPSYPTQNERVIAHMSAREEMEEAAAEVEQTVAAVTPEAVKPAEVKSAPVVPTQVKPAAEPAKRMTPEEVQAAREAALNAYRRPEEKQEVKQEEKHRVIMNEDDHQFDTSKLDISKIVGFNDELERQFSMVDSLDHSASEDKGGDQE